MFKTLKTVVTATFLAFGLLAAAPAQAATLYAITFDDELITIDTTTGAGTLVGSLSTSMGAFGLGATGGALYTYDQSLDRIQQLDPLTAATLLSIDIGLGNLVGEGSLAFDAAGNGYLTLSSGNVGTLYSFTLAGGGAVVGGLASSLDGLDFHPTSGVLYGLGQSTGTLFTVNPATAALTTVGATGVGNQILAGLAFDAAGNLFAAFENGNLYSVNIATGAATLIGFTGFNNISGLTFFDAQQQPIPEPASLLLIGGGLAALARRRQRARRSS